MFQVQDFTFMSNFVCLLVQEYFVKLMMSLVNLACIHFLSNLEVPTSLVMVTSVSRCVV